MYDPASPSQSTQPSSQAHAQNHAIAVQAAAKPLCYRRQVRPRRADPHDRPRRHSRRLPTPCRQAGYNFLEDVTCVDWYPTEPRFQITYHILSHSLKAAHPARASGSIA